MGLADGDGHVARTAGSASTRSAIAPARRSSRANGRARPRSPRSRPRAPRSRPCRPAGRSSPPPAWTRVSATSTTKRWPSSVSAGVHAVAAEGLEPADGDREAVLAHAAARRAPRPRRARRRPSRARRARAAPPRRARPRRGRPRCEAGIRSSTSRPSSFANMLLRETPIRTGRPSAASSPHAGEQGEVVVQRLAEADARIQDHVLLGHPGVDGRVEALGQVVPHLGHHVVVARVGLHGARRAPHVHQAHGRATLGHQGQQGRVGAAGRDVVDQHGPRVEGGLGHRGERGVDRQRDRRRALAHGRAARRRAGPAGRPRPPARSRAACSRRRRRRWRRRRRPSAPAGPSPARARGRRRRPTASPASRSGCPSRRAPAAS